jgi:methyl-accepting chemotaxis protein
VDNCLTFGGDCVRRSVVSTLTGLIIQRSVIRSEGITLVREAMRGIVISAESMRTAVSEMNSGGARDQAGQITRQMNQLGDAAQQTGRVTEAITEISAQTNLLALNATIEAARAGAAGKGFAVVATEIKALAQQTSAATDDIRNRIDGVQSSAAASIREIEKVSQVIDEVSQIVTTIATAIEEQAVVTKDIARNIAEASLGVQEANERISESSLAILEASRAKSWWSIKRRVKW